MRVFLAAFAHETNSFSPLPTTMRSFAEDILYLPGETDVASFDKSRGFAGYADLLAQAEVRGDEVVAGMCAWAQPSGPLARRVYEGLRDRLLDELRAAGPIDMVLLVLHGAMMADGYPDCEGDLLMRVRRQIGPAAPLGALLDLHGNVSSTMAENAVLIACKEYPHTDYAERSAELYAILAEAAGGRPLARTCMCRVPMLGLFGTTEEPMRSFVRSLQQEEGRAGIRSVSAMHGFPWSDSPNTGAAILVVHDPQYDAERAAEQLALRLAGEMFRLRTTAAERLPLNAALATALDAARKAPAGKPVVLADGADNPGGGAAGDATFVLKALLEHGASNVALGMIWDPLAVSIAADAGVGARIPLRIGGKVGPGSGTPVDLEAEVLCVREDARQTGLGGKGSDALGIAVAIRVAGIDIVLNTLRQQVFSPDCFTELGINLATKRLVVVKSTQHFRTGFDPIASATVYCDTPGTISARIADIPYRYIVRPAWPLDPLTPSPDRS